MCFRSVALFQFSPAARWVCTFSLTVLNPPRCSHAGCIRKASDMILCVSRWRAGRRGARGTCMVVAGKQRGLKRSLTWLIKWRPCESRETVPLLESNHKRLQISQKEQKWNPKYQMRIVIINSVSCFLVVCDLLTLNMKTCWSSDAANTLLHTIWKKNNKIKDWLMLTRCAVSSNLRVTLRARLQIAPLQLLHPSTPYRCVTLFFILHLLVCLDDVQVEQSGLVSSCSRFYLFVLFFLLAP